MTIVKDYLKFTKQHKSQYGEKTIVLMQVGSFFEVYALKSSIHGKYVGSDIKAFSQINDMAIAKKNNRERDEKGILCDVVMAGFGLTQLDKYVNKLQKEGYTIVVYTQDIQAKNTTRSLSGIISPGTHFSSEIDQLSNHIMCIWIEKSSANKILNEQLTIGTAVLDVLTGFISASQFDREYYHNPCTYDELEKIVAIYKPSECIIISNLSKSILDDIVAFTSIQCKKIHMVEDLSLYERTDCTKPIPDFAKYAMHAGKQKYQIKTIEKFYPTIPNEEIIDMFPTHWVSLQSLTFLLNFVHQHNPNLVHKLQPPKFENHSDKLILANHSLKQLNIISDNTHSGKLCSVSNFLNNCVTIMGKREFIRVLHNPTTNIKWLNDAYHITDYALENNLWLPLREKLTGINDIEKFSRKLAMKKVFPKDLSTFYHDTQNILLLYNEIQKDTTLSTYITETMQQTNDNSRSSISDICQTIMKHMNDTFHIDKCNYIYNLTSESLASVTNPEDFFIKQGVSSEIDQLFDDCVNSHRKLEAIRAWLSSMVATIEKTKKKSKMVTKSVAESITPTSNFIKIHSTPKTEHILMGTNRRITLLKSAIEKHMKQNDSPVTLHYEDGFGKMCEMELECNDLEYFSIGSNKKDTGVTNKLIRSLTQKIQTAENKLVFEIIAFFNNYVADFMKYHDELRDMVRFTTTVDILQCRAYIANKYNYCKPTLDKAEKAFFSMEGVRHPLIEHLQTNELYVTNDITLGEKKENNYDGLLLYGTNAVGKTSLIKSIGIAIIMAQAGLYVPCKQFRFSPYTSIFTRILGNDDIFKGLSTFAVEMSELRTILRLANKDSLILGDELCSGTESDSALSIFTAGLEKLHETECTHLFATHFHEIQHYDEIKELHRLRMMHMAVTYDRERDILIYDRKLHDGPGDSMYGLEVCKSLNLPPDFLDRAHFLRTKYNDTQKNLLHYETSHFNSKKIKGDCEMCGKKGTEVHHLQHQNKANGKNSYIGSFHKNHNANLITVCEECHHDFHDTNKQHRRVKTSGGYNIVST